MAEQRSVSRWTSASCFTSVRRSASPTGPCSMVRIMSLAKVRMPASGLLISWAMEAESLPSEESFSVRTRVSWAARSSPVRSATFSSSCSLSDWSSPSTRRSERIISLKEAASSPSSPRASTWISVSSSSWATRRVAWTSASTGRTTRCLATYQKTAPSRSARSAVTRRLTRRKAARSRSTGSSETPTSRTPTHRLLARVDVAGAGGAVGAGPEGRDHGEDAAAAAPRRSASAQRVDRHGQALVLLVAGAAALGPLVDQLAPLARAPWRR